MGTRVPKGSGKKGKVKSVDEVYEVIDHELKPYKPKLINAAAISDKIIRRRMKVDPSTPSPEQGKTYKKKRKK
jgi:hypothetical protein